MEIRRTVKEGLPQINQLITDHPESFVKVRTAARLHDRNKLSVAATTKESRIIGFAQADEQQSEERVDQQPAEKLVQHALITKEKMKEIQKRFAEYLVPEAKERKIKSFFAQF